MSEYHPVTCKVQVRKYVLVSLPSRWRQRGERVVVQSTMLVIPNHATHVPVKRYNGEEQNSVCSLPREDIEKDSSGVYEKSRVTTTISWVDAHGVALCDSSLSDEFKYRRNDKFWICIGSNTKNYTTAVPVINLRTNESGVISIDHVCWYPKIRGPGNELWTPGGNLWTLKLCGPKKFMYFSWVICQRLPTAKITSMEDLATTTKSPQVPTKEVQVKGTTLLSAVESRELFEKRLRFMEISRRFKYIPSPETLFSPPTTSTSLSTPPCSPDLNQLWRQKGRENGTLKTPVGRQQDANDRDLWGRILAMIPEGKKEAGYILKNSPIHPQELLKTQPKASQRQSSIDSCPSLQYCESVDDDPSECITVTGSGSSTPRNASSSEPMTPDVKDLAAADILLDIFHDDTARSAVSATSPTISNNTNSIYDAWQRNKPRHNPFFDGFCDQGDAECQYSTMFPCKHYHSPPAKCLLANLKQKPAPPSPSRHGSHNASTHECCISRLSPLPSGAGSCMLSSLPSRNHACCWWAAPELDGMSILHKRDYDKVSIEFHISKRMRILDRTELVDRRLGLELGIGISAGLGLGVCDEMGTEGKKLQRDLEEGVLMVDGALEVKAETSSERDELSEELGISPLSLSPPRERI